MKFEARQYQQDAVDAWYPDLLVEGCHPLIAVPTAAGKSIIMAMLLERYLKEFPDNHVLVLSHTQEIIKQDYDALLYFLPDEDIGVYSAGLGEKNKCQITLGTIQTVIRSKEKFKWANLIIVDEVQAVNHRAEGNYRKLFKEMMGATIAGMSATIYRQGHGYIYEGTGTLFNKLSYDLTSTVNFNKLEKDGYICKLVSVAPETQLDSSHVKKTAGDYNAKDLSNTHDKNEITSAAIEDALRYGKNYKRWLVFAIDINHCNHICDELNNSGIDSRVLHTRMSANRADIIDSFKDGGFRALVSVGMVSIGFDVPNIDLILMLRPTMSTGLHVQMCGRGLRIAPGKDHCLVLDYSGNTARLGPINNPIIPTKKGDKGGGEAPTKTCPKCRTITYTLAKFCESCGHEFIFKTKLTITSSSTDVVDRGLVQNNSKWLKVTHISYDIHTKIGAPNSMLVKYICGIKIIKEWICIQHSGFAGRKAEHWAKFRGYKGSLNTTDLYKNSQKLNRPSHILVDTSGKYDTIKNFKFEGNIHVQAS